MEYKPSVLIVHNYYRIPGGEDTVVKNEKNMLEQYGHSVVLYTRHNEEIKEQGILVKIFLGLNTIFSLKTYREVKRIIREEKIDVVHVHNTLSLISPSVYYAALKCKIPVVQTVHNFRLICPGALLYRQGQVCEECITGGLGRSVCYGCYRESRMQTFISALNLWVHRILGTYKRINYICLTDFNKGKLLENNRKGKVIFPEHRIYMKPNFTPEDIEGINKVREDMFVYVGRLQMVKGIQILLEAWKQIPDKRLVICGSGPEEAWCKEYIEKNHMDNVKLMGQTSKEKVMEFISKAQAMIFPSRLYEGFPMTIVESFSCGTPVIVNDIGNGSSLIEDGFNGYKFKRDSVEDLVRVVTRWKGGMYENAKNTYLENYTMEKNYEMLNEIYTSVLENE